MDFDIYRISDLTSRMYFEDVLQSFYSKNYRATIVLLYSLIINDLYSKLLSMQEGGLLSVEKELDAINNMKKMKDPKYSDIENKLYSIYVDKNILNKDTIDMMNYLRKIRNKCAHPIFADEAEYYSPLMEECRMFITKAYNDILIVDAYIKDPYRVIKNSLENKEWNLYKQELFDFRENEAEINLFNKYFEKRYLNIMNNSNYIKLFKSLINMLFKNNNKENIKYQYRRNKLLQKLLDYLSKKGRIEILINCYNWDSIDNDTIYDEIPKDYDKCQNLTYMFQLLTEYPLFISEIKEQNELLYNYLKKELDNSVWYIIKYYSIFYETVDLAIKDKNEDYNFYKIVLNNCIDKLDRLSVVYILEKMFLNIPEFNGYDLASEMCDLLIKIIEKEHYNNKDLKKVLEIMNNNRQIYDTSRNSSKEQFKKLEELGIELDNYENLGK